MPYAVHFATICGLLLLGACAAGPPALPATSDGVTPPLAILAGLPPLPDYHATGDYRLASSLPTPGVTLTGTQYMALSGDSQVNGSAIALLPSLTQLGYLIYALPPTGLDNEMIGATIGTSGPTGYWAAVSDYAAGRWQWFGPLTDFEFTQACPAGHQRADGTTFVALVAYGGNSVAVSQLTRTGERLADTPPPDSAALTVGAGKTYATLEAAYAAAPATGGATILVYPQAGNAPYSEPHLLVDKPGITFWGLGGPGERLPLDGGAYNYTGAGSVPRAVFQFDPGSDGGTVRGFRIYGAHNDTYNGAAVRINQANHISVIDCEIYSCDMGLMSNGDAGAPTPTAADQWVGYCLIHSNGNAADPGYNHNLYMGGTSFTLHACDVYDSLTGHNVKSRAHFNRIEYCYIHDSANREFDLVDDAANTALPGSDSVLIGNVVVKDFATAGNRNVIHFGQDGGNAHNGTLLLLNNTLVTPYISPVVALDTDGAKASFVNNILFDAGTGQNNQVVADATNGASLSNVTGSHNWLSHGFLVPAGLEAATTWQGSAGQDPPFVDSSNFHLYQAFANVTDAGAAWGSLTIPPTPGRTMGPAEALPFEFIPAFPALDVVPRLLDGALDLGAYEFVP
jgi:hypothetical protein